MARLVIPPLETPIRHPRKMPFHLPPQLDPSCLLCLLPIRDNKWYDFSGKGNHGTIHGATWTAKGRLGPAFNFDGLDNYIRLPDDLLSGLNYCTIEMGIKLNTLTDTRWLMGSEWADPFPIYIQTKADGNVSIDQHVIHSTTVGGILTTGDWFQFVAVKEATTWSLYRNEVFKDSITSADYPAIDTTTGHFYSLAAGKLSGVMQRLIDGLVDEMRIYNRALSALEIKALYEQGREIR